MWKSTGWLNPDVEVLIDILALPRRPRAEWGLPKEKGVYALFLNPESFLDTRPSESGLLYLGKAENRNGLQGRCHFEGRTVNHSPRKSLASLLSSELSLKAYWYRDARGRLK